MATTEKTFETIPVGTNVTWHYRSAIGHGTVIGVHKYRQPRLTIRCTAYVSTTTIPASRPSCITMARC